MSINGCDAAIQKNIEKENANPLISVVVPVYNIQKYIGKCIESIINQTYGNLEIILVDDGSKDNSGEICDEYAKRDNRIKVIHKENGGLVSARKAGIREAAGEYAAYVDGDDWIDNNMYSELAGAIGDADVIVSGVIRDYKNYSACEVNKISEGIYQADSLQIIYKSMIYTGKFFERGIQPHVFNALYKTDLLLKNQLQVPDEVRVMEDAACFYPVLLDAKKIVLTNTCYYHYVMRSDSIMGKNDNTELERYKILYQYFRNRFSNAISCKEELLIQLDYLMLYGLLLKELGLLQSEESELFPYVGIPKNAKAIVYGTGRFGKELMQYLNKNNVISVVLWTDCNSKEEWKEAVADQEYDYVIISVLVEEIADEIEHKLLNFGVEHRKIKRIDSVQIDKKRYMVDRLLNNGGQ